MPMNTTTSSADLAEAQLLADPAVSYWLKAAIVESRRRDLLDALSDAQALAGLLETRVAEYQGRLNPHTKGGK